MDEKVIFTYLAEKVVEDIRNNALNPEIALALSIYPFNDYVRKTLLPKDSVHIERLFATHDDKIKAFALMICRPFQSDEGIKKAILALWEKDRRNFPVGFASIYRLLEYDDITSDSKIEFLSYIKDNWSNWKEKLIASYPEPSRIIPGAMERIGNPDFPEWKKWIYLVEIACSPERAEAKTCLEGLEAKSYPFLTGSFAQEVKKWAISKTDE